VPDVRSATFPAIEYDDLGKAVEGRQLGGMIREDRTELRAEVNVLLRCQALSSNEDHLVPIQRLANRLGRRVV